MAVSGWSGPRAVSVMASARCSQRQRVGGPSQVAVGGGEVAQRGWPCAGWSGPRAVSVMASARCSSGSASAGRPRSL